MFSSEFNPYGYHHYKNDERETEFFNCEICYLHNNKFFSFFGSGCITQLIFVVAHFTAGILLSYFFLYTIGQ